MRREYDFSKAVKNPYSEAKKSLISIRLDNATIQYFKELSTELGVPYQTLINSFLADCVTKKMRPSTSWQSLER